MYEIKFIGRYINKKDYIKKATHTAFCFTLGQRESKIKSSSILNHLLFHKKLYFLALISRARLHY